MGRGGESNARERIGRGGEGGRVCIGRGRKRDARSRGGDVPPPPTGGLTRVNPNPRNRSHTHRIGKVCIGRGGERDARL